jgi:hypothetical protein
MSISERHPELFHYTNIDGVKGIIKSNSIWATHYNFLNDDQEMLCLKRFLMQYCKEEICLVIKRLNINEQKLAERFQSEDHIAGMTRVSVENMQNGFLSKQSVEPYVASFCSVVQGDEYVKNNGLLSQWRGYAEGGYAVVFDTKKIEELVKLERYVFPGATALPEGQTLKIGEVVYNEEDLRNEFPDEIKILKEYVCWLAETSFIKPDKLDERIFNEATFNKMLLEWVPTFLQCVALYKHEGFKEEREIRIVAFLPHEKYLKGLSISKKEVKLRNKKTPYLELFKKQEIKNVKTRYESNYLGIKRIIVGPSVDKVARATELKEFLAENKKNIEVVVSETPYINQANRFQKMSFIRLLLKKITTVFRI